MLHRPTGTIINEVVHHVIHIVIKLGRKKKSKKEKPQVRKVLLYSYDQWEKFLLLFNFY